uniref:Uncharacterized protein n=1 Tax=Panagrolaimus sp. PS1159 TaxID=55785 RepID=A0AC35F431_9BILA
MKEMCKMHNPASKITGFILSYVDGPLNVNDYLKFIQEHVYRSGSRLLTDFISTVPKENLEKLRKAASYEVNEWPRPRTRCWFISRPD